MFRITYKKDINKKILYTNDFITYNGILRSIIQIENDTYIGMIFINDKIIFSISLNNLFNLKQILKEKMQLYGVKTKKENRIKMIQNNK